MTKNQTYKLPTQAVQSPYWYYMREIKFQMQTETSNRDTQQWKSFLTDDERITLKGVKGFALRLNSLKMSCCPYFIKINWTVFTFSSDKHLAVLQDLLQYGEVDLLPLLNPLKRVFTLLCYFDSPLSWGTNSTQGVES